MAPLHVEHFAQADRMLRNARGARVIKLPGEPSGIGFFFLLAIDHNRDEACKNDGCTV